MKKHLIRPEILSNNIWRVGSNDGQADKKMEIVNQVVRPTCFPDLKDNGFRKLALETSEKNILILEERNCKSWFKCKN